MTHQCVTSNPTPDTGGDVGGVVPEECPAGRVWSVDAGQCLTLGGGESTGGDDGGCAGGGATSLGLSLISILGVFKLRRRNE